MTRKILYFDMLYDIIYKETLVSIRFSCLILKMKRFVDIF